MKLYFAPGACSQAVHITLREAGIPFTAEKVDLRARKTEGGRDWNALAPKGYVPLLELDDGQTLSEAAVILQYVADRKPESGLAPANGTMERYRLQEWLTFISSELHKAFGPLFNPALPAEVAQANKERAMKRFQYVATQLGDKPYLLGDRFTVADAYLFVMLSWATGKFKMDLSSLPSLGTYAARIATRPKVKEALKAEGF